MTHAERYDVLIVDGNNDRRMRLKTVTVSAGLFGQVTLSSDFRSSLDILGQGVERVIVFIGPDAGEDKIKKYIDAGKETSRGRDSAYVLLVSGADSNKAGVASGILEGIDSVLLEPFSVDSLVDVTKLAATVYRSRRRAREEAAVMFLIEKSLDALDEVAAAKAVGRNPGEAVRDMKAYRDTLFSLDESLRPYFYSKLIAVTDERKPPAEVVQFRMKQAQAEENVLARLRSKLEERGVDSSALNENKAQQSSPRRIIRKR